MTQHEPADDLAKGTLATAKQSWRDLFVWKQRVVLSNEYGETRCEWHEPDAIQNPFSLFAQLSAKEWLFFLVGLCAWTADAFDFHALSIQTVKLAGYYRRSKGDITTAITLTLLLRSVGAAAFGLAGDKWGRKWPMVFNMVVLGVLQIATIYSSTFSQFLAVRSLFGLFMGGVYGNAIAMALEQCPYVVSPAVDDTQLTRAFATQLQCPWLDVGHPAAGLFLWLCPGCLRQPGRRWRHGQLEDGLLDRRCVLRSHSIRTTADSVCMQPAYPLPSVSSGPSSRSRSSSSKPRGRARGRRRRALSGATRARC